MTQNGRALRAEAATLAAPFPPLLAAAERLAATVQIGEHGRGRAGPGDAFWQYRAAASHDSARAIDWRRSARSDATFVQDKEWQIAQSVVLWTDAGASMRFASAPDLPTKAHRARLIALATAILLDRGGERVGYGAVGLAPRRGRAQIARIDEALNRDAEEDHVLPDLGTLPPRGHAVLIGDFMGDLSGVSDALGDAAARGVGGALLQVLDPQEERFPFNGRTVFHAMGGGARFETRQASDLRERYLERLAERKDALETLCRHAGWHYGLHRTSSPASGALLWLFGTLGRQT